MVVARKAKNTTVDIVTILEQLPMLAHALQSCPVGGAVERSDGRGQLDHHQDCSGREFRAEAPGDQQVDLEGDDRQGERHEHAGREVDPADCRAEAIDLAPGPEASEVRVDRLLDLGNSRP